ncbi:MAG: DUF2285 domain-containing protein [Pseudomonadota bacterium]|nr:DUF2285 domain-containing protein [Pseudomonadota bacterium]
MAGDYGWNYTKRYFDRLLWLSYSGWAWEFKRRDARMLGAHRAAGPQPIPLKRSDGSRLFRLRRPCRRAERFGMQFMPDPRLSAYETPIFWLPDVMTTNLDAAGIIREQIRRDDRHIAWQDIPGKKSVLLVPGRRPKLSIAARGYSAQLTIEPASTPLPMAVYLTVRSQIGDRMLQRLRCLEWFAHHCAGLEFEVAPRRGYAPHKLRNALIALDGWLANGTQREIASAIFGADAVRSDWDRGIHAYKSRTRRLIKKGRDLMQQDYLKLL